MDEIRQENLKPNPEQKANVVSRLFFCFVTPLLRLGYKKPLETKDLYQVLSQDESQFLCTAIEKAWDDELNESQLKSRPAKLHNAIYRVFGRKYLLLGLILIFEEFVKILQPMFMGRLIRYFRFCSAMTLNEAYFYAFGFSMCAVVLAIWHHPYFYHVQRVGMQIRVAVSGLIYTKILKVNASALREMEVGKIVNMLSNDVARFDQTVIFLHYFWAAPLSMVGFLILLWYEMGPSCLAGFGCLLILVPIQGFMGRKMGQYRRQVASLSDKRIGIMNELLNGIRVIKMYAWEKPFSQLVDDIRWREIKKLRLQSVCQGLLIGLFFVTGKIIVLCALFAYILGGNGVGAELVFVASALFNTVRLTLTLFLPFAMQFFAEYKITLTRIEKFLFLADKEPNEGKRADFDKGQNGDVDHVTAAPHANFSRDSDEIGVEMSDYSAKWGGADEQEGNALHNINLVAKPGQLIIIVGPVGAGKSSILHSLCGEATRVSGQARVKGRVVYVPQEAWIFSASVRQNVIFGRQTFESHRYDEALEVCQMRKDIETFSHGDATVVGDKGVALSGGQKSRINLARAVYFNADVYLLDDPLSAVDAAVGRLIFEECIMKHMAKSIRILVTHQLQYLKHADCVVVMKDGHIAAQGKYEDLEKLGDHFTSILHETEESYKRRQSSETPHSPSFKHLTRGPSVEENNVILENSPKVTNTSSKSNKKTSTSDNVDGVAKSYEVETLLSQRKPSGKDSAWKRDVIAQFDEEKSSGLVGWSVYLAYFRHMGSVACVVFLFTFCVFVQIVFNLSDWWLNIWATTEDSRRFATNFSTAVNQSINEAELNLSQCLIGSKMDQWSSDQSFRTSLSTLQYFYSYAGLIFFLTLISLLRSVAFRVMLNRSGFLLHSRMFSAVLKAPVLFFDRNPAGRILNRFSKDTGTMDEHLSFVTFDFIQGIITFLGIILMIGFLNPLIFIPTLPLVCMFLYARFYYMRTARVIKRLEATTKSPMYSHVSATLNGLTSIRSYKAENSVIKDFHRHQNMHTTVYSAFLSTGRWFSLIIDWLCSIFVTVVAFISVWSAADGASGEVGLSLFYASTLMVLFSRFLNQSVTFEYSMIAVERILEYSNLKPEADPTANILPAREWPQHGSIEFLHVRLRYSDDSDYVLKDMSFKINPGEKIGIVGRTGAGKSSVLNALFRLSKVEGQLLIDGVDTQKINLYELRKRIAIIPQDPVLFIGPLRKNLDPFNEFSDDTIWSALDHVELKSVFLEYEKGLDSHMQEGGANLSVGQRQLVCLARALLRKQKILVLDEATANVDLHTDRLIQKTIRSQFKNCTVMTIAHRLNTIVDSSRVMVVENGEIIEMDHAAILLRNKKSFFSQLVGETGAQNAAILTDMAEKALADAHT